MGGRGKHGGRPAICVVGASLVDLIAYVPRLPRVGETLHGTDFRVGNGGKGAKQTVVTPLGALHRVTFNGLGRVLTKNTFDNSNPLAQVDVTTSLSMSGPRNLRLVVGSGGEHRRAEKHRKPRNTGLSCAEEDSNLHPGIPGKGPQP